MMDGITLHAVNAEAARRSQRARIEPVFIDEEGRKRLIAYGRNEPAFGEIPKVPYIGDREPRGWKRTGRLPLFCSKHTLDVGDGHSLSVREMAEEMRPGYGYGVIEEGQFQCYVAEFRACPSAVKRLGLKGAKMRGRK